MHGKLADDDGFDSRRHEGAMLDGGSGLRAEGRIGCDRRAVLAWARRTQETRSERRAMPADVVDRSSEPWAAPGGTTRCHR